MREYWRAHGCETEEEFKQELKEIFQSVPAVFSQKNCGLTDEEAEAVKNIEPKKKSE